MPRKHKPEWYEYGFPEEVEPFRLKSSEADELAAMLDISDPERHGELIRQLQKAGDNYRDAVELSRITPSVPKQRAALDELLSTADDLRHILATIDHASQDALWTLLDERPRPVDDRDTPENGFTQYEELRIRLEHLTPVLTQYLEDTKPKGGRPQNTELQQATETLIDIYEEFSGSAFTHTAHEEGSYTAEPRSPGDRFVHRVMSLIDGDLTASTITSAIGAVLRRRKDR